MEEETCVDWGKSRIVGDHTVHEGSSFIRTLQHRIKIWNRTWTKPDSSIWIPKVDPKFEGPPEGRTLEILCPFGSLSGANRFAVVRAGDLVEVWSRED